MERAVHERLAHHNQLTMKIKFSQTNLPVSITAALCAFASPMAAQEIQQTKTIETVSSDGTTTSGTISEFGADRIVIKSTTSEAPVRYTFSKTTTYVDEAGNPVSVETVKSGLPVTVQYEKVDGQMVASKVIVKKSTTMSTQGGALETTTTTTKGTVSEFGPDRFTVRTESSANPVQYGFSKTTTYVDESGQPVARELVKSGAPVTVYYTKTGDGMVASKVVVRKTVTTTTPTPAPIPVPPPVIEEKTTTTTRTVK